MTRRFRSLFVPALAMLGMVAWTSPAWAILEEVEPLRVMSFNIRYANASDGVNRWDHRKSFLIQTIRDFDPDLLGTQETLALQRDQLAEALTDYGLLAAGRDDGRESGEMMALFYRKARFEKLDGGHFWLSETPETPGSTSWDSSLPRMVTWVKLRDLRAEPDAQPILYFNTHLDHRGPRARLESSRLIRARLAELGEGCRWIVTGDFNAGEGSDPYRALFDPVEGRRSPLVDSFRVIHPERGPEEGTFTGFRADSIRGDRIDWIACSRDWDIRTASIDRTQRDGRTPSDHAPVTAVLRAARPDGAASQSKTLRILCYNIHHGEGMDGEIDLLRIARVIRAADPDLVALQEVDDRTRRSLGIDQTAELARLTGLFGHFGKAIEYQGGGYGQAILSRVPFTVDPVIHTLPGEPEREQRIAVEARFRVDDLALSFVTTHLHHQEESLRARQAARLNELLANDDRPVILAGDLNAPVGSSTLDVFTRDWDRADAPNGGEGFTYPASQPTKRIDFVLSRPPGRFQVVETRVIDEPVASDHRPVLVILRPSGS